MSLNTSNLISVLETCLLGARMLRNVSGSGDIDVSKLVEVALEVVASPNPVASKPVEVVSSPNPVASKPVEVVSSPNPIASKPVEVVSSPNPVTSKPVEVVTSKPVEGDVSKLNSIDWNAAESFVQESIINKIDDLIKIAGKYNGKVFGGYVRNVLVPREFGNPGPYRFKDVDLWFSNERNAALFLKEMGDALQVIEASMVNAGISPAYPFARKQYNYIVNNTIIGWIDVVISDDIPVDDFNVNRLTYFYNGSDKLQSHSYGPEPGYILKEYIIKKNVTVLESYQKKIRKYKNNKSAQDVVIARIYKYKFEGWTISYATETSGNISTFTVKDEYISTGETKNEPKSKTEPKTEPKSKNETKTEPKSKNETKTIDINVIETKTPENNEVALLRSEVADLKRTVGLLLEALKEK